MGRGIWGQYEGFIGIRTMDEIYLVSGSGKELYFRPDEWAYWNLAKDTRFTVGLKKCREKLGDSVFPIEIYGMEKFRKHLELLAVYDNDCWQSIMAGLACLRWVEWAEVTERGEIDEECYISCGRLSFKRIVSDRIGKLVPDIKYYLEKENTHITLGGCCY